jgi:peptidoglycan/xylan/chitin deacetylase (PgdA/CDA1 family)
MKFFLHRSPTWLRWLLSDYTWTVNTLEKEIYLTFDDGPIPEVTEYVMDELERHQAEATFFCIGDNVRKHPDIFRELKRKGHSVGNHTFNHLNGWKTDNATYLDNFLRCQDILETDTVLFRPPYGRIKKTQFELLPRATQLIMWDVLTGDFSKDLQPEKVAPTCIRLTRPGTIMLLHDSIKADRNMRYILPRVLEHFSERGYLFKAMPMR